MDNRYLGDSGIPKGLRVSTASFVKLNGSGLLTVDEGELDGRRNNLNEGDSSPGPVIRDSRGPPSDAGHQQSAQVPQTIVDGSHRATVLRMADFSQEKG